MAEWIKENYRPKCQTFICSSCKGKVWYNNGKKENTCEYMYCPHCREHMYSTIEIVHPNGYIGRLYGNSSMIICDENGKEVMHTGSRNVNTKEELYKELEEFPKFINMLMNFDLDNCDDEDLI